MARFLQRITAVSLDGNQSSTVYKKKKKKKRKVSKWLKPAEKMQRRRTNAIKAFGKELSYRHKRSNRKRRNGFMRDGGLNMARASRKGMKKLFKW